MNLTAPHPWTLTTAEARAAQLEIAARVSEETPTGFAPRHIGGIDVGFEEGGTITRAVAVVLDADTLTPLDAAIARSPTRFPYVPGLLSFREMPAILEALAGLRIEPELLMVDGQGRAHPRRCGIACHLGVVTGLPAVGVGKSILVGSHGPVPDERGQWTPLVDRGGDTLGAVLRSRVKVAPLIVSVGHRLALADAISWVMACNTRFRLPEPTRWADAIASRRSGYLGRLPDDLRQRMATAGMV
jgi:deoxyribonuclease V